MYRFEPRSSTTSSGAMSPPRASSASWADPFRRRLCRAISKSFKQNLLINAIREPQRMAKWAKDATNFTVSVTHNVQNTSSCIASRS